MILSVRTNQKRDGFRVAADRHIDLLSKSHEIVEHGRDGDATYLHTHVATLRQVAPSMLYKPAVSFWCVESSIASPSCLADLNGLTQMWTPSEASASALRSTGTHTPVIVVPHPIEDINTGQRKTDGPFTVLSMVAGPLARKSPESSYAAFASAFPSDKHPDVRWILKARSMGEDGREELKKIAARDPRITLVTQDVESVLPFYEQADVLLSMHLAGAFEMICAEAAIFGLPVVSTKVGGVLDYLPDEALVDGERISPAAIKDLNKFGFWIQPDIALAARKLRELYENKEMRLRVGEECRRSAMAWCSPSRIAGLMNDALALLPEKVELSPVSKMAVRQRRGGPPSLVAAERRSFVELEHIGQISRLSPVIASHRRSGTHHLGEFVQRNWGCGWSKTHDWPERIPAGRRRLFAIRNPVDALASTWRWFNAGGGSKNRNIEKVMERIDFSSWLDGDAGRIVGFSAQEDGNFDNLSVHRGMFYDPVGYWRDMALEHFKSQSLVVVREKFLKDPEEAAARIGEWCFEGEVPKSIDPVLVPVGMDPRITPVGAYRSMWSDHDMAVLEARVRQVVDHVGYKSVEDWAQAQ